MKDELKCKVVMLPTNKAKKVGDITKLNGERGTLYIVKEGKIHLHEICTPQYLYFISKREIKEGDYGITSGGYIFKCNYCNEGDLGFIPLQDDVYCNTQSYFDYVSCSKVEATTDTSLNIPLIGTSFIEKFVEKQGKIEEVMIEMNQIEIKQSIDRYDDNIIFVNGNGVTSYRCEDINHAQKIINLYNKPKTRKDNTVIIHPIKELWTREEMRELFHAFLLSGDYSVGIVAFDKWIEDNL